MSILRDSHRGIVPATVVCGYQRCADMYPRIDILRISAILTDTDRIRIVISLYERTRIRIRCHGYCTDMHIYALVLFINLFHVYCLHQTQA